jgi:hypothetical protein
VTSSFPASFGGLKRMMVSATGTRMHAPPAHPLDDLLVGHVDFKHVVEGHASDLHRFGLRQGARETIKQITVSGSRPAAVDP